VPLKDVPLLHSEQKPGCTIPCSTIPAYPISGIAVQILWWGAAHDETGGKVNPGSAGIVMKTLEKKKIHDTVTRS
jgi:hypothetical protein